MSGFPRPRLEIAAILPGTTQAVLLLHGSGEFDHRLPHAASKARSEGLDASGDMFIHQLSDDECVDMLRRTTLGRLGCAKNNHPYVVPIYFKFDAFTPDAKYLYSFANLGQKIFWMRANPSVCVEVEEVTDEFHWTTVIVSGRFEELTPTDHAQAAERAYELLRARQDWWQPAAGKTAESYRYVPIVYRIRIDAMSGRRAAQNR